MDIVRSILTWFVRFARLPKRTITRDDGRPYLERWYLCGEPGGLKYFGEGQQTPRWWQRALTWLPCIYIHRFVSDDMDEELHNHPWEAVSLIVAGGYVEERRLHVEPFSPSSSVIPLVKKKTVLQEFRPGMRNYIFQDTFHKVTLIEEDCWSIIACKRKVSSWGFWSPRTNEFVHWREHVARKSKKPAAES